MSTKESEKGFQVTDRRFWVEEPGAESSSGKPQKKYPSFVEELKARTEAAEKKLREKIEQLDQENSAFRSRLEKHVENRLASAKAEFIGDLLEVVDNLELAVDRAEHSADFQSLKEGIELILSLFLRKLRSAGVEPIESLEGDFDPNEAEAVSVVPVDHPEKDHKVVTVLQKGYRLGDKVLRPARVQVGQYSGSD